MPVTVAELLGMASVTAARTLVAEGDGFRIERQTESGYFDVVSRMEDVISLGVGEPDFGTAWRVREAAIYGLERGRTTYTGNSGLVELRTAIAGTLNRRYRLDYDPESEYLVTIGVSEGLDLALRFPCWIPATRSSFPTPHTSPIRPASRSPVASPVWVPPTAEDGFVPEPKRSKLAYHRGLASWYSITRETQRGPCRTACVGCDRGGRAPS